MRVFADAFHMHELDYCFVGLFKMFVLVFNLVPYVALVIVG